MVVSAGDYFPGVRIRQLNKATAGGTAVIARGDVLWQNGANVFQTAAVSGNKFPFAVCTRAPLATDSTVDGIWEAIVYVTADGVINPGNMVTPNGATTPGRVVQYVATSISTTPAQADVSSAEAEFRTVFGVYEGHENENSLNNPGTPSAQGDVIRVRMTRG
jgi:hypothetical protein